MSRVYLKNNIIVERRFLPDLEGLSASIYVAIAVVYAKAGVHSPHQSPIQKLLYLSVSGNMPAGPELIGCGHHFGWGDFVDQLSDLESFETTSYKTNPIFTRLLPMMGKTWRNLRYLLLRGHDWCETQVRGSIRLALQVYDRLITVPSVN